MFDGLEGDTTAVVAEDAEVHLEPPVIDLVLVVAALAVGSSQVRGAHLTTRERSSSDLEMSPQTRRLEHVEPVTTDATACVSVGERQHLVDLLEHEDRHVRPHAGLIANRLRKR